MHEPHAPAAGPASVLSTDAEDDDPQAYGDETPEPTVSYVSDEDSDSDSTDTPAGSLAAWDDLLRGYPEWDLRVSEAEMT